MLLHMKYTLSEWLLFWRIWKHLVYIITIIYIIRPQGHSLDHIRDMSFHIVPEMPRFVIIKI